MMALRRSKRLLDQQNVESFNSIESNPTSLDKRSRSPDEIVTSVEGVDSKSDPATPLPNKRRRIETNDHGTSPISHTPAAVGVMFTPLPKRREPIPISQSGNDESDEKSPTKARTVDPHQTNAILHTATKDIIPHASDQGNIKFNKILPNPELTTSNILEKAISHLLSVDPSLKFVIDTHHCHAFSPTGLQEEIDPFRSLASGIMAQQVSGAAASSIKNKFINLFPKTETHAGAPVFPDPVLVASTDLTVLRTAGLSQRKAEYIQGLAEKFSSGELSAEMLGTASDDDVMEKLVAVRGLGKWSVEMFCCFGLKRMDVFSTGDLGVQYV